MNKFKVNVLGSKDGMSCYVEKIIEAYYFYIQDRCLLFANPNSTIACFGPGNWQDCTLVEEEFAKRV